MVLISKFKDYYDYLIHQYGKDPNIVWTRKASNTNIFKHESDRRYFIHVYICGYVYDGIYDNGKFYYGEDLLKFNDSDTEHRISYILSKRSDLKKESIVCVKYKTIHRVQSIYLSTKPYKDIYNTNKEHKSPICIYYRDGLSFDGLYQNRMYENVATDINLSEIGFAKVLPAQEIYLKLVDWLTPVDEVVDTRTNEEKILTNGFDLKTSFRH